MCDRSTLPMFSDLAFLLPSVGARSLKSRQSRLACHRKRLSTPSWSRRVASANLNEDKGLGMPDSLLDGFEYDGNGSTERFVPGDKSIALETDFAGGDPGAPIAPREGGDGGDDDDSVESALRSAGRSMDELPEEVRTFAPAEIVSYLSATSSGVSNFLAKRWTGWARRCAADAEFPFKVLMELTVGLGLSASGMIAARGKDILKELDFAICDIAVGGTVNFILVYLLTPVAAATVSKSMFANLPANVFIAGPYSLPTRLGAFMYKGALFAVAGFGASLIGTAASQALIAVRGAVAPSSAPEKPLPNVVVNSAAWAGFMLLSANPRYQAVAGVERALFSLTPDAIAKAGSAVLRTGNNVAGGAIWVWWARYLGLQPTPVDPAISVPGDSPYEEYERIPG